MKCSDAENKKTTTHEWQYDKRYCHWIIKAPFAHYIRKSNIIWFFICIWSRTYSTPLTYIPLLTVAVETSWEHYTLYSILVLSNTHILFGGEGAESTLLSILSLDPESPLTLNISSWDSSRQHFLNSLEKLLTHVLTATRCLVALRWKK